MQEECDSYVCNYDSLECSYNVTMYGNCSAISQGIYCYDLFQNGVCDRACSSEECLFDGWDCEASDRVAACNPIYDSYCGHHYNNGHCDRGCHTAECGWDGQDCDDDDDDGGVRGRPSDDGRRRIADGTLIFIILVQPEEFHEVNLLLYIVSKL